MTGREEWSSRRRSPKGGRRRTEFGLRLAATFMRRVVLTLIAASLAAPLISGQRSGQIRPRPAEGRQPEFQPPTIREYKPKSTLVVPQHPVPRAKFPVIDIHGHPPALTSEDAIARVAAAMDPINVQVMVNASGASGERLQQQVAAIRASRHKDRFVM